MSTGPFRLGLRTFKTALAVMLCILLFQVFNRDTPMIACLSAVFAMREDLSTTLHFSVYRIAGNFLGGSLALFYFYVYRYFNHHFMVELLMIPLLVTFIIVFADAINFNPGIVGACATLFIIVLTVPETQTFWYGASRVMDTVFGTVIAIVVNRFVKPPQKNKILNANIDYQKEYFSQKEELAELKKELASNKLQQTEGIGPHKEDLYDH